MFHVINYIIYTYYITLELNIMFILIVKVMSIVLKFVNLYATHHVLYGADA
jgi:hypothetical protein